MPPGVHLIFGFVMLPCALVVGWDALLPGSPSSLLVAVAILVFAIVNFVQCGRLRASGVGWWQRPTRRRR